MFYRFIVLMIAMVGVVQAAAAGDGRLCRDDGDHFYRQGVTDAQIPNWDKARESWEEAAKLNHANALLNLGFMYSRGQGVDKNQKNAVYFFDRVVATRSGPKRSAADDLVDREARFNLGLAAGCGVGRDDAMFYYYTSALLGHKEAYRAVEKAAVLGDANAQFYLGNIETDGCSGVQNKGLAVQWWIEAANMGHVKANEELKKAAAEGYTDAAKWLAGTGGKKTSTALHHYAFLWTTSAS